jgi:hypothetical protein
MLFLEHCNFWKGRSSTGVQGIGTKIFGWVSQHAYRSIACFLILFLFRVIHHKLLCSQAVYFCFTTPTIKVHLVVIRSLSPQP